MPESRHAASPVRAAMDGKKRISDSQPNDSGSKRPRESHSLQYAGPGSYSIENTGMTGGTNSGVCVGSNSGNIQFTAKANDDIKELEDVTASEVEAWNSGMVEVAALQQVLQKLKDGAKWITIVGKPGEGKTTLGYMLLQRLKQAGTRVFRVDTPADFLKLFGCKGCVIMLNDPLGSFTFDQRRLAEWENSIHRILGLQERTKEGGDVPRVIFISRRNVVEVAKTLFGHSEKKMFHDPNIVDLSGGRGDVEKMNILNHHLNQGNMDIQQEVKDKIVKKGVPHGFPHCCRVYVELRKELKQTVEIVAFFSSPLDFLDQTTKVLAEKADCLYLFEEMLAHDGKLDITAVEDTEKRRRLQTARKELLNSYLADQKGCTVFSHPSIHESVAQTVANKDVDTFLQTTSLSFLQQKLYIREPDQDVMTGYINLELNQRQIHTLVNRFESLVKGLKFEVFASKMATNSAFCQALIENSFRPSGFMSYWKNSNRQDVNSTNDSGYTVLIYAIMFGNYAPVPPILDLDANVNIQDQFGKTALQYLLAENNPNMKVVKLLLEHKADVNIQDQLDGGTPFHQLCTSNGQNGELMKLLLENNAFVNKPNTFGDTALHKLCLSNPAIETMRLLLEKTADVNQRNVLGCTALSCLCKSHNGNVQMMKLLLKHGADVTGRKELDPTPLYCLCEGANPDVEMAKVLIEHGASVNVQVTVRRYTPLHLLCIKHDVDEVVKLLLDNNADPNSPDMNGCTVLSTVLRSSKPRFEIVKLLVDYKANVNIRDKIGRTPLHFFCKSQKLSRILKFLLDHNADVNAQDMYGSSPLHYLCYLRSREHSSQVEQVKVLLEHKADVNIRDHSGKTPLWYLRRQCDPMDGSIRQLLQQFEMDITL